MGKFHLNFFKLLTLKYQDELQIIKEFHLTLVEHSILQTLNFYGQITPRELAGKFALSKSTLTYVLDSLEKKGLVERRQDKNDRRSYFVYLTQKGKKTVRKILTKESAILIPAFNELSDKEKTYWDRLIESLVEKSENHIKKGIKRHA